jgi:hypothetical protein
MATESFYTTVGSISFILLGLWWVVVQGKPAWHHDPRRRRMATGVSLHFLLPGAMSILALVAPDVGWLWRLTFVTAGLFGLVSAVAVAATLREDHDCPGTVKAIEWIAIPTYAVITLVAAFPELITGAAIGLTALQVEGIILSVLLVFGVLAAWILMIEPPREAPVVEA